MRDIFKLISFLLIAIGTIGLLLNEFAFDWGRAVTVLFAALNVVGLVALALTSWHMKKE